MEVMMQLKVADKRTGATVETVRMICTNCDCENLDEFEREYAEDIGEFMLSNLVKGNYPESAFNLSFGFCRVFVDGETIRFGGCE